MRTRLGVINWGNNSNFREKKEVYEGKLLGKEIERPKNRTEYSEITITPTTTVEMNGARSTGVLKYLNVKGTKKRSS